MTSNYPQISDRVAAAVREVERYQGILLDPVTKSKSLKKFGERLALGTSRATVWESPAENETYLSSNGITHVVSSDVDDDQVLKYEYHTISGGEFSFGVGTVTLNGRTAVELPTATARVSRAYNSSGTLLQGAVSFYEGGAITNGVPNDNDEIHATITAGHQSTNKAATTISKDDYYLVTDFHADILKTNSVRAAVELEIREQGGVFRPAFESGVNAAGTSSLYLPFDPVIIVPCNADIRVTAVGSTGNIEISAYFSGFLASIIGTVA